jgi:beta-glucosidase
MGRIIALWTLCLAVRTVCAVNVTNDSYFFGQSPAVFPSPAIADNGPWAEAVQKARAFVSQLTLEEKMNLTCGTTSSTGCGGYVSAIPRLGFEGMCLQDGSHGVHGADRVNSYASEIAVGAR